jgi:hypothetical protein
MSLFLEPARVSSAGLFLPLTNGIKCLQCDVILLLFLEWEPICEWPGPDLEKREERIGKSISRFALHIWAQNQGPVHS